MTLDGGLYTWGWGGSVGSMSSGNDSGGGQLGHGNEFDHWEPKKVAGVLTVGAEGSEVKAINVSCGFNHSIAVMKNVQGSSSVPKREK